MKTNDTQTLTAEQMTALVAFANKHGADWKEDLLDGWRNAAYPCVLQQIRNQFGPVWLRQFELPKQIEVNPEPDNVPRVGCLAGSKEQVDHLKAKIHLIQAKNDHLAHFQKAYNEWMDKMEWAHKERGLKEARFLGLHLGEALRQYVVDLQAKIFDLDNVIVQRNGEITRLHNEIQELKAKSERSLKHPVVRQMLYAYNSADYETVQDAIDNVALYRITGCCNGDMEKVFLAVDTARNVTNATNDDLNHLTYAYLTEDGVWLNETQVYTAYLEHKSQ